MKHLVDLIFLRVKEIYREMMESDPNPKEWAYQRDNEGLSINYMGFGTPSSEEEIDALLREEIGKRVGNHGRVFLYHCPDNCQIGIEYDPTPEDDDALIKIDEIFEADSILPNHLFIGWD